MAKSLIIYFSRADENYAVGYIEKGNTEIAAEYAAELETALKETDFDEKTVRIISTH